MSMGIYNGEPSGLHCARATHTNRTRMFYILAKKHSVEVCMYQKLHLVISNKLSGSLYQKLILLLNNSLTPLIIGLKRGIHM